MGGNLETIQPAQPTQSVPMSLNTHDIRVVVFHGLITLIQLVLIGLKVENPQYAPYINPIAELIRRFIV